MKSSFLILFFFLFYHLTFAQNESILTQLDQTIRERHGFDRAKLRRIEQIKLLARKKSADPYQNLLKLYDEYNAYNYDSAYVCIKKLQQLNTLNNTLKTEIAKIKLGFILLSSGMFKEGFDTLNAVKSKHLPVAWRAEYYSIMGKAYYNLGDYSLDTYYTGIYNHRASRYIDSALQIYGADSYPALYLQALRLTKERRIDEAKKIFQRILKFKLTYHQYAITASTLADIYINEGKEDTAILWLAKAAIADIKSATKETTAILNLAKLLYRKDEVERAYSYIHIAAEDATFYGARQRKIQINAIQPIIAAQMLNNVEAQKRALFLYASIITVLSLLVIVFATIIFKQVKKLRKAEKLITASNLSLQEFNRQLSDANRIKEAYIGNFISINSEYLEKLERFKKSIDSKLKQKSYEDIQLVIDNIKLHKEREDLYRRFDKTFLDLFPNFVKEFNKLFEATDQIIPPSPNELNTELRIFALLRMGITENEKIAQILDYSVNTIYAYKNRLKNKSKVPNDEFDRHVMQIPSV